MDFEYQNGTGPMDGRSPFAQISINQQQQRQTATGNEPSTKKRGTLRKDILTYCLNTDDVQGMFAAFGSPSKPSMPSLREAASQPHLFTRPNLPPSPTKPLPSVPFSLRNNPLFSTPRKLDVDLASSGGETPKSPERDNVDSDATPDNIGVKTVASRFDQATMPTFTAGSKETSKKDRRRDSWWSRAAGFVSSPGRGEVPRGVYSDKIVKRVRKKRSREAQRQLARARRNSASDSEDDAAEDGGVSRASRNTSGSASGRGKEEEAAAKSGLHPITSFFEFLDTHPRLPHILSWYLQLTLNLVIFSGVVYALWAFWSTIRADVDKKSNEAIAELMAEMAVCAQQYTDNRCPRDTRVPAMEVVCNNWEKCMNRDVRNVARARVSAHTFAEIFNSFLEPISYKAMVCLITLPSTVLEAYANRYQIFTLVLVFGCVALSNVPFSMFRNHQAANAAANHHHYYGGPPPPTPQRQFSGGQEGYWTPFPEQPALEPAPSSFAQIEGQPSPIRKLQYR